VTLFIAVIALSLITPKAAAKQELLFNKLASVFEVSKPTRLRLV